MSRALVIGEIALSFVALGGGSLLVRSFLDLQGADSGFESRTDPDRDPQRSHPRRYPEDGGPRHAPR